MRYLCLDLQSKVQERLTCMGRSKLRKSDALWEAAQRSFEAAFGATEFRRLALSDAVSRSERLHRNFRNGAGIDRPVNIPETL